MWYGIIRKGGVTHFGPGDSMDTADLALCGKVVPIGGRSASSHSKLKPTCKACAKSWESQRATRGDNQNADKGNNVTATQATATDGRDKAVEEINDAIDRLPAVTKEGGDVEALKGEIETSISALKGKGVAAIKAELRAKAREVADAALVAAAAGAELASLETDDFKAIEGLTESVDVVAQKIADGLKGELNLAGLAREIATDQYHQRIRMTDKNGNPDWRAESKGAKALRDETSKRAGELFGGEDTPENRAALNKFLTAVMNQRQTAMVLVNRSFDEQMSDEERTIFAKALAAHPDMKPSEAIATYHKMPKLTKPEQKAINDGRANALDGEGDEGEPLSPEYAKLDSDIQKLGKILADIEKRKSKLTKDAEKEKLKARLESIVTKTAALATKSD